jgi:serine/threonine-protein kinase
MAMNIAESVVLDVSEFRDARFVGFDGHLLDRVAHTLHGPDGRTKLLRARWFDVLDHLLHHRDRVVPRDELLACIWARRVVEENNLTQAIAALRRALGARAGDHRVILTIPGAGYRFVAMLDYIGAVRPAAAARTVVVSAAQDVLAVAAMARVVGDGAG